MAHPYKKKLFCAGNHIQKNKMRKKKRIQKFSAFINTSCLQLLGQTSEQFNYDRLVHFLFSHCSNLRSFNSDLRVVLVSLDILYINLVQIVRYWEHGLMCMSISKIVEIFVNWSSVYKCRDPKKDEINFTVLFAFQNLLHSDEL